MIDKLLFEIIKKRLNIPCFECTVISVDKTKDTCNLKPTEEDRAEIKEARLTATVDAKETKMVAYPTVNSTVVVILLNDQKTDCLVVAMSEIDEIKVNCLNVVYNNGIGGMIHIDPFLVRLNAQVTALKAAISAGFSAQASIDTGLGFNAYNALATPIVDIVKTTFEDTKIKH